MNAWITRVGCALGTPRIFATKRATNWAKGSSFPWLSPRREVVVGLGRALARKFSLNSFASWLNEEIKDGFRHLITVIGLEWGKPEPSRDGLVLYFRDEWVCGWSLGAGWPTFRPR
ncbi:hypothetical protein GW17_00006862 [Ensete ventricosum]|nr:hypothetical protein GW17_00006862 [Ensete ventricosum]